MLESPYRGLGSERGSLCTPSKDRMIQSIPFPTFGNEENQENSIVTANQGDPKRPKLDALSLSKMEPHQTDFRFEGGSDCGTETSSTVSARREWLKEFGRQHENKFPQSTNKNTDQSKNTAKPPAFRPNSLSTLNSSAKTASAASTLVNKLISEPKKLVTEPKKLPTGPKKMSTPVRMKPRPQKEGVQATDEGYASVAQLSQWLASDPTSTKKKKHVRRGKNVITKSRQFEKDMENVIVIESSISRGAVSDKKKWLQCAFHEQEDSDASVSHVTRCAKSDTGVYEIAPSISVADKKDWLKRAFKTVPDEPPAKESESRSEIITNDAAASLSVSDKKDWLKNAFTKKAEQSKKAPAYAPKAKSDIMHCRRENRDEIAARAKRKFLERSNNRTPTKVLPKVQSPGLCGRVPPSTKMTPSKAPQRQPDFGTPSREQTEYNHGIERKDSTEERTAPPSANVRSTYVVDEDTTPVDFRNARDFLIQRSKKNGHEVQVVNKVFQKKNKFEQMEKEMRRRSGPKGLLKTSWAQPNPTMGRPSDSYEKTYVSDIAPKKSFEELP